MQRFKNILCVIEHGEDGKPALERAVELAQTNQASLTVIDVVQRVPAGIGLPDGGPISVELQAAMVREREVRMKSLIEPYLERLDMQHKVLLGTSFLEVIREVLRNQHDLVIKCPESPSWLDRFFSGDDMNLLRKCPCPVWFVKPRAPNSYRRVLVAVDVGEGYPSSEQESRHELNVQILEMAASLAIPESAELHIVHAWESVNEMASGLAFSSNTPRDRLADGVEQERLHQARLFEKFISDWRSESNAAGEALDYLRPLTHLVKGAARKEIPDLAKRLNVDCIVMGTVARTGIRGFIMGNTAETILEQIDCSVLAIKPPGFETPVMLED
tara:strand:+ start:7225 stop:8214 length:990 start_codon:yes stop_codon:yes gene_type:complete